MYFFFYQHVQASPKLCAGLCGLRSRSKHDAWRGTGILVAEIGVIIEILCKTIFRIAGKIGIGVKIGIGLKIGIGVNERNEWRSVKVISVARTLN